MKVDLPDPLAPIRPKRLPPPKRRDTFSNRGLEPNWMVILEALIMGGVTAAKTRHYRAARSTPPPLPDTVLRTPRRSSRLIGRIAVLCRRTQPSNFRPGTPP